MAATTRTIDALMLGLALPLLLAACGPREATLPVTKQPPRAVPVEVLPLDGPAAASDAEISAMCWCGDRLVLMPQHPERYGDRRGELGLFVLDRAEVVAAIDDPATRPLVPRRAVLHAPDLIASLPGWDGIEAVVAVGDTVFVAVEARVNDRMAGYLLRGRLRPTATEPRLDLDTERVAPIPVPTMVDNMSQEALVITGDRVAVLFEANGVHVNPGAHVALFDFELAYQGTRPIEHVEYRITDACRARPDGTFWVMNYFFPGEGRTLAPPVVPTVPVEHLLELRLGPDGVVRSGRPPLDLRHDPGAPARNWEALVRLDGRGFLLMTDRYPETMLAFVPWTDADQADHAVAAPRPAGDDR
ncbi:hypothetical protein GF314_15205 [bacterium]|nr:hypothetical protein [bacterium]